MLDDYQFINSQDVHEAVAFILEYCPNTLHLVMATRSDPPLSLARMRARGQLVELRSAALRFTESEAAQFLNDIMGLHLEADSVMALEKRTEGWIAGLQMAALSIRDRKDVLGFIEGFSGTNRYIMDYLLEEVLASQPPEIQRFLLYTSTLERLTGSLCDFLLASLRIFESGDERVSSSESFSMQPSGAILEDLERLNLFLVPLDAEQIWYRYHHLFADLLRARLHQIRPGLAPRLHIRAADWLEQKGFIGEAVHHLFLADQIDQAADLIEHYGPARLVESDPSVLQMTEDLPQDMVLARPKLGLYQGWLLIIQGRIGKAISLLNDLARQLAVTDSRSGQQWMETFVVVALAFLVPPTSASKSESLPAPGLLEEIPPEEPILRNAADFLYAMALDRQGDLDRAVKFSVRCIQREKALQEVPAIPTLAPFLTRGYLMQGRLHEAVVLCQEYLDPLQESEIRFIYTAGSMKIDLGEVLCEWNRLEEAEQHIREGLSANEPWGNVMTDSFGLVALTRVLQAQGDYAGAMQVVEQLETEQLDQSRPREFEAEINTLRVRVQLANGDLQNPARWADQILSKRRF